MSLVSLTMSLMVTLVVTLVALTVMRAAGNKFGKFEPVGNSDRFKLNIHRESEYMGAVNKLHLTPSNSGGLNWLRTKIS